MRPETFLVVLNLALIVWLIVVWRRSGFLAALNLLLYGTVTAVGAIFAVSQ
ncbi:MAG: hypothetical protein Q7U16_20385 [Agitococcus sp.]|nr:hypothetical protein [Agitococcus sp.]